MFKPIIEESTKQDEMQTGGWLTSKEVHTCHATSVELCYFFKSKGRLATSLFPKSQR